MNLLRTRLSILVAAIAFFGVTSASGQSSVNISLTLDATRAPQKLLHTHMVMPVKAGPLTLYYPKWIPGEHTP